jgi:hypothetical protein
MIEKKKFFIDRKIIHIINIIIFYSKLVFLMLYLRIYIKILKYNNLFEKKEIIFYL